MRWGEGGGESLDGDEEGESCREKRKREWEVRVCVWDVWLAARYTSPYPSSPKMFRFYSLL